MEKHLNEIHSKATLFTNRTWHHCLIRSSTNGTVFRTNKSGMSNDLFAPCENGSGTNEGKNIVILQSYGIHGFHFSVSVHISNMKHIASIPNSMLDFFSNSFICYSICKQWFFTRDTFARAIRMHTCLRFSNWNVTTTYNAQPYFYLSFRNFFFNRNTRFHLIFLAHTRLFTMEDEESEENTIYYIVRIHDSHLP